MKPTARSMVALGYAPKPVHKALLMSPEGKVSPLCRYYRPRPINMKIANWTLRRQDTTCPKCRVALAQEDFAITTGMAA